MKNILVKASLSLVLSLGFFGVMNVSSPPTTAEAAPFSTITAKTTRTVVAGYGPSRVYHSVYRNGFLYVGYLNRTSYYVTGTGTVNYYSGTLHICY
ncbi:MULTISPECIES: hypothetical protein [Listeria]|uniref:hypothetical protein n=1 Tax=Listeria TaxID=1637 RepID=UPI000B58EABF|nr:MULTISPECIES: hypothetical protein [Listeria]